MNESYTHVVHTLAPVYDEHSRILILGSFPSVKSRENRFYYGNPNNRFWRVISAIAKSPVPETIDEKKTLLLSNGIAIWDVIHSCDIKGSSDSSIRNVTANDLTEIFNTADIRMICGNGAKACDLYRRYIMPDTGIDIHRLPSTSPANAAATLESLISSWTHTIR